MARISNTFKYPFDLEVYPDDYLIGTDNQKLKKTKNYQIRNLVDYIISVLTFNYNSSFLSFSFKYSVNFVGDGDFSTDILYPESSTKIQISLVNVENKDLLEFITLLNNNHEKFFIKISDYNNLNIIVYYELSNFIEIKNEEDILIGYEYDINLLDNLFTPFTYEEGKTYNISFVYLKSVEESDPIFTTWLGTNPLELYITDTELITHDLSEFTNVGEDPFAHVSEIPTIPDETDPVFTAWLNTNPLGSFLTTETDPVFSAWLNTNPLGSFLTTETDPVFNNWLNSDFKSTNIALGFQYGSLDVEASDTQHDFNLAIINRVDEVSSDAYIPYDATETTKGISDYPMMREAVASADTVTSLETGDEVLIKRLVSGVPTLLKADKDLFGGNIFTTDFLTENWRYENFDSQTSIYFTSVALRNSGTIQKGSDVSPSNSLRLNHTPFSSATWNIYAAANVNNSGCSILQVMDLQLFEGLTIFALIRPNIVENSNIFFGFPYLSASYSSIGYGVYFTILNGKIKGITRNSSLESATQEITITDDWLFCMIEVEKNTVVGDQKVNYKVKNTIDGAYLLNESLTSNIVGNPIIDNSWQQLRPRIEAVRPVPLTTANTILQIGYFGYGYKKPNFLNSF